MDDKIIEEGVEKIWADYDKDNSGELDKEECERFVKDMLESCGGTFDKETYDKMFSECIDKGGDKGGDGKVDKKEMVAFIKEIMS
jgi:Ca2+-binding EF-hand superfamily protein